MLNLPKDNAKQFILWHWVPSLKNFFDPTHGNLHPDVWAKETELISSHVKIPILHQFAQLWDLRMERYISKFNCIVALTSKDKASWKKFKNVMVIPNMITYPLDITHMPSKRIISVGRLNYQKGFDILIDVWSSIANKYPDRYFRPRQYSLPEHLGRYPISTYLPP